MGSNSFLCKEWYGGCFKAQGFFLYPKRKSAGAVAAEKITPLGAGASPPPDTGQVLRLPRPALPPVSRCTSHAVPASLALSSWTGAEHSHRTRFQLPDFHPLDRQLPRAPVVYYVRE